MRKWIDRGDRIIAYSSYATCNKELGAHGEAVSKGTTHEEATKAVVDMLIKETMSGVWSSIIRWWKDGKLHLISGNATEDSVRTREAWDYIGDHSWAKGPVASLLQFSRTDEA